MKSGLLKKHHHAWQQSTLQLCRSSSDALTTSEKQWRHSVKLSLFIVWYSHTQNPKLPPYFAATSYSSALDGGGRMMKNTLIKMCYDRANTNTLTHTWCSHVLLSLWNVCNMTIILLDVHRKFTASDDYSWGCLNMLLLWYICISCCHFIIEQLCGN